jgi:hypothetical protein
VIRGLLRFLAYSLAFWFIYRVVVGALRNLTKDARKRPPDSTNQSETKTEPPPDYHDVKDARFKDLPKDSSEHS